MTTLVSSLAVCVCLPEVNNILELQTDIYTCFRKENLIQVKMAILQLH
jgi:hypothetical protein